MSKVTIKNNDHIKLINYAVDLLDEDKEKIALPYLEKAYRLAPECPSAIYNLANCYYQLASEEKAIILLEKLLSSDNSDLKKGCPDESESPEEYKLDSLFVLFRAKLFLTQSWNDSYPYAIQHLKSRRRGLKSAFTLKEIKYWIKYYKEIFDK
ncbi:MAG: tetratricopeptide repeat protein [bacterium]|nr:tetratricopeptide repeat protein [bacterium]